MAGIRVLIVEDQLLQMMALEGMLESLACVVVGTATSVDDGVSKAAALDFDIAIVDLKLRGQNGQAIVEEVARRHIPMIIVSGYDLSAWQAGPDFRGEYVLLQKPFTFEELRSAVLYALE
jgi:DNA-binding NtrC family response regulator